jgi:hypothetical protein
VLPAFANTSTLWASYSFIEQIIMEYFKIELDGSHFAESYLVYIIEVSHNGYGRFFYIGQTGDRHHFTARPAFRRLSAHLNDQGHSTENQLYRHIARKILNQETERSKTFGTEIKTKVGDFLRQAKICMHVFPVRVFDRSAESDHKINRIYVESVEQEVIAQLAQQYGQQSILNSKMPKLNRSIDREVAEYAAQLIITACP